jgi:hypothetical protein
VTIPEKIFRKRAQNTLVVGLRQRPNILGGGAVALAHVWKSGGGFFQGMENSLGWFSKPWKMN